jgi:CHASE2 domain-containing sensor protein
MAGHLDAAPPDPAGFGVVLPPGIVDALRRPLAKDPTARPSRASDVARDLAAAWLGIRQERWRRVELPRRLAIATLLAGGTAAASPWIATLEPIAALERRTEDVRFALRPARPADPRILILAIDEDSLASASAPLAARSDEVSRVIEGLFEAGAMGVALDLVLPAAWSASPAFSELVVRRADRLRLAAMATRSGTLLGAECVAGLAAAALGPQRISALFGLVNVHQDEDGRVRDGRIFFRDVPGGRRPSWAGAASSLLGIRAEHDDPGFVLDLAVDPDSFPSVPWRALPELARRDPGLFQGKLVLIGGDRASFADDAHRLASALGGARDVPGVVLQAMMVQTLLEGRPVRRAGQPWRLALAALGAAWTAGACLTARTPRLGLLASGMLIVGMPVLEALSFRWTGLLLPLVVPAGGALLAAGLALAARSRLTPCP